MSLEVLFENDDFIAIKKPSGVIVHPWKECSDETSLLYMLKEQTGKYIYPVHRLDRAVSGVIVFAYSSYAARLLKEALESDETQKIYLALCMRELKKPIVNEYELFNQSRTKKQSARTGIVPLQTNGSVTLCKARIYTGRYHQIRRHFSAMGHHLIGDTKYGKGNTNRYFRSEFNLHRLFLHCLGLKFTFKDEHYQFIAAPTSELVETIKGLGFLEVSSKSVFDADFSNLPIFSKRLS